MAGLEAVLPQLLPITAGPYALELIEAAGGLARLRFKGLERRQPDKPERAAFVSEDVPLIINNPGDPRLEAAVRAWAVVVRDVLGFAATWPATSDRWLGPMDVLATHLFDKALKKKGTKKEAQFLEEWRALFHELLPPRKELNDAAAEVDAFFGANAQLGRGPRASLVAVAGEDKRFAKVERDVRVTVQLIIYDEDGTTVRDIKEQECTLIDRGALSPERVRAFLEAWRDAIGERLSRPVETLEVLMPYDFVEPALELVSPKTKEQFAATFKKRWAPEEKAPGEPGTEPKGA